MAVFKSLKALANDLESVVPKMRDERRKALEKIGKLAAGRIADRMLAGIPPDITRETRERRKENRLSPALIDSGELFEAVTATEPGVPYSAFQIDEYNGRVIIGVQGRPDAAAHEFGIDERGHYEPAREFIPRDPAFWDAVVEDSGAIDEMMRKSLGK